MTPVSCQTPRGRARRKAARDGGYRASTSRVTTLPALS